MRVVLRKAAKLETWKSGLKQQQQQKKNIWDWKGIDGKWCDQNLCIFKTSGFMALAQATIDIHSDSLTFDLTLIFIKKRWKSAKSNPIFHLKGRRDTSSLYHFWIAQWVNFFPPKLLLLFLISPSSSGEKSGQSWTKSGNSGYLLFL